jgi:hypothetical protein
MKCEKLGGILDVYLCNLDTFDGRGRFDFRTCIDIARNMEADGLRYDEGKGSWVFENGIPFHPIYENLPGKWQNTSHNTGTFAKFHNVAEYGCIRGC